MFISEDDPEIGNYVMLRFHTHTDKFQRRIAAPVRLHKRLATVFPSCNVITSLIQWPIMTLLSHPTLYTDQPTSYWLTPRGIPIPIGYIFQSPNRPKFDFSVRVINPREIPIPKRIKVKSEKLVNSQENSNSHGIYFPKSKPTKIQFFSSCNKSHWNSNSQRRN